jgi:hypothetical protein
MATTQQVESTQYNYCGLTGNAPNTAEVAYLPAGTRPTEDDWNDAVLVTSNSNPLWAEAIASGAKGAYFVARLVGAFNSNDLTLAGGSYQEWLRLTGTDEQKVFIAPNAFTVAAG